jgi:hypothetical protein
VHSVILSSPVLLPGGIDQPDRRLLSSVKESHGGDSPIGQKIGVKSQSDRAQFVPERQELSQ